MAFSSGSSGRIRIVRLAFLIAGISAFLLPMLSGCGGGGGGAPAPHPTPTTTPTPGVQTTPVTFGVTWGARSRALTTPSSALSLQLVLKGAHTDGSDLSITLNRGSDPASYTQTVTTTDVARTGAWQAAVTCYSQAGAAGSLVGAGQATVTIAGDGSGIGDIAIGGAVVSVAVTAGQSLTVGAQQDLAFTCRNASGALLAISPGSAFFTVTSGTNLLTIVNGQAKALLPGTASVQAKVDGINSASTAVQITSSASVSITPPTATLFVGDTATFTAQVDNAPNSAVTWSVQEGVAGGSISPGGVYTTPANAGTFHVVATSTYDPSKQATATVTVQSGTMVVYQNEFDGTIGSEWSNKTTETTPLGARRFLGRFGKQAVSLSLANLPSHKSIMIAFKLFIIRSWDGNEPINVYGVNVGPDLWKLSLDGSTILNTTFGNWEPGSTTDDVRQSYPNAYGSGSFPSRTGASEINTLGYPSFTPPYPGPYQDTVYNLTFTVPHTASTATFVFDGGPNQDLADESWGIDSVKVTTIH